jgi:hypothetical protein
MRIQTESKKSLTLLVRSLKSPGYSTYWQQCRENFQSLGVPCHVRGGKQVAVQREFIYFFSKLHDSILINEIKVPRHLSQATTSNHANVFTFTEERAGEPEKIS